jgi:hypothetical protein
VLEVDPPPNHPAAVLPEAVDRNVSRE